MTRYRGMEFVASHPDAYMHEPMHAPTHLTPSLTHSLTYSLNHARTHARTHAHTHTRSLTHTRCKASTSAMRLWILRGQSKRRQCTRLGRCECQCEQKGWVGGHEFAVIRPISLLPAIPFGQEGPVHQEQRYLHCCVRLDVTHVV